MAEIAVDHRGDVGTAPGLADLEFTYGGGTQQHRAEHEGVHAGLRITEQVVGPALDTGAQDSAVAAGGGKTIGQLVPDDRLGQVVQVGDQHLRGRDPGRDRMPLVVGALGEAGVAGKGEHRAPRLAEADQALGGDEQVDHRHAEGVADGRSLRRADRL